MVIAQSDLNGTDKFMFSHICESMYPDISEDMILNEGLKDIINKMSNYHPKKILDIFQRKYSKLESRVDKYRLDLKKQGVNVSEIDRIIKNNVKRVKKDLEKQVKNENTEKIRDIAKDLIRVMMTAISTTISLTWEKIVSVNPPDLLKPLMLVVSFTSIKLLAVILVEIATAGMLGVAAGMAPDIIMQILRYFLPFVTIVFLGPYIDNWGRWAAIETGSTKYYAVIKSAVEAPLYVYYLAQLTGKVGMAILFRIVAFIFEKIAITDIKDTKSYGPLDTKTRYKLFWVLDVVRTVVEAMIMGTWVFSRP